MGRLVLNGQPISPQQVNNTQERPGFFGQLGHGIKEAGASLLGLPGQLLESGKNSEFAKSIKEQRGGDVLEPSLPGSEYFLEKFGGAGPKPKGFFEQLGKNIGNYVPSSAIAAATGGVSALPGIAGGLAGGALAETAADQLNARPLIKAAAGLAGSITGGIGTNKLLPSRAITPKVESAQRANQLAEVEREFVPKIKDLKDQYKQVIQELPKEKVAFTKARNNAIKQARNDLKSYDKNIRSISEGRTELYNKATELQPKGKFDPESIYKTAQEVKKDLRKGLTPGDRNAINNNISQLNKAIGTKKKPKLFTVKDAKEFQKNFNDQIYNGGETASFNRQMQKLKGSLNEFIERNSSPEHNKYWQQAEIDTKIYKDLKKNRPEVNKAITEQIRDLGKEKLSPIKEVALQQATRESKAALSAVEQQYKKTLDAVGKGNYEQFISSPAAQNKSYEGLEKIAKFLNNNSLAGLAAALGSKFFGYGTGALASLGVKFAQNVGNELSIAKNAFSTHREIFTEYVKEIMNASKNITPQTIQRLNSLGDKMQQSSNNKNKKSGGRLRLPTQS